MNEEYDFDLLRDDLINYFGTAVYYNPLAKADLLMVTTCNDIELINIALKNNFDLFKYEKGMKYEK